MPRRSKIDRLPDPLRTWLREKLHARGFADYDDLTTALNARLEAEGIDVTIGRTSVLRFGRAQQRFADLARARRMPGRRVS